MNKTFTTLFYVRKGKITANGTAAIYCRITIDGKRTEITTKRSIEPLKWNPVTQKANGNNEETRALNAYLKTFEQEILDAQHHMMKDKENVTAETIKNKVLKIEEKGLTLIPIFQDHNNKIEALLNKEFAPGTLQRYKTSLKHTVDFLKWKFKVSDVDIRSINHAFITEYEFYLRSVRNCANNSAVKYIKNFGKIIRICLANGWLEKNPFANYKSKIDEVEIEFLNEGELFTVCNKYFFIQRLELVRDGFIFCCYTGLAYAEVKRLDPSHIVTGIDGEKWIYIHRKKTNTLSKIPLLPEALALLEKYKDYPQCLNTGKLLPVLSNQKMNSYLKEIGDVCGITKNLTFHIARHTFATTVTLSNGVPIESVSQMLGHKTLKMTQHYAKIVDRKLANDMAALRIKLSPQLASIPKTGSN